MEEDYREGFLYPFLQQIEVCLRKTNSELIAHRLKKYAFFMVTENCVYIKYAHPHLTRRNHLHFGVDVVGMTQKKVWATGSPLSER